MPNQKQLLEQLHQLQAEVDTIRRDLGFSAPGTILFSSLLYTLENDVVLVEADGFGGATTCILSGHYPLDYIIKSQKHFTSEDEAISSAEDTAWRKATRNSPEF